jgi:5-methylcytosine-specific restriction endonuclease McrA
MSASRERRPRPPNRHALLLACARSDATFEPATIGGIPALVGRCIHCGTRVSVGFDGRSLGGATLEHIVPKTHGGDDSPDNLAVACAGCNHGKGRRLDARRRGDPTLERVIELLRERRAARLREPIPLVPPRR